MENKNNGSVAYLEIIKNAFQMTWKNRYLWWLGFFAAFTGGGMRSFDFSPEKDEPQNLDQLRDYFFSNLSWIIPAIIALLAVIIILIVLGTIARAGIMRAVEKIEKKETFGFKLAMREGKPYFWKLLLLSLILGLALGIIIAIVTVPVATLFAAKSYIVGGILAFLAFLILVPLVIIFTFIRIFAQIYIVLGNLKLKDAIENAYYLFLKNIKKSILMALLFIPMFILLGLVFLSLALVLLLIFGILGIILFFIFKMAGAAVAIGLAAFIFIFSVFAIGSFYQAFAQIVWVLFFKEIASPKVEETLKEIAEEEILAQKNPEPCSTISTSKID